MTRPVGSSAGSSIDDGRLAPARRGGRGLRNARGDGRGWVGVGVGAGVGVGRTLSDEPLEDRRPNHRRARVGDLSRGGGGSSGDRTLVRPSGTTSGKHTGYAARGASAWRAHQAAHELERVRGERVPPGPPVQAVLHLALVRLCRKNTDGRSSGGEAPRGRRRRAAPGPRGSSPARAPLSKVFLGILGLSDGPSGAATLSPYTSTGGRPACCISAERPDAEAAQGVGAGVSWRAGRWGRPAERERGVARAGGRGR